MQTSSIGIIGGSGLYEFDALEINQTLDLDTPFGKPSAPLVGGLLAGRQVWFLARHGKGHTILPTELNHKANIWALKSVGVDWIISITAVGSLREDYAPRDMVIPHQLIDHTSRRSDSTFFGKGIVAHPSLAHPYAQDLRDIIIQACAETSTKHHTQGTYINMDGPAFSTQAESQLYRQWGCDIIGMTNAAEAKLAREAEIAFATLSMVTDYDCWHPDHDNVEVAMVIGHLMANAAKSQELLQTIIPMIPQEANSPEHKSLECAIITAKELWPEETINQLKPILQRFL